MEIKVGQTIRSFDFYGELELEGPSACFMEGVVTEVGDHSDGHFFFEPTRVVFGGEEDSPEDVAQRGIQGTYIKTWQGNRLESGALQILAQ